MKDQYLGYVLDMLEPHGPITSRKLFGGHALYYDGVIFATIIENQLYFKVDVQTRGDFEEYDSKPFVYTGKNKPVTMPYMTLPEVILENQEELPLWIEKAYQVSLRHKSTQKNPKRARKQKAV